MTNFFPVRWLSANESGSASLEIFEDDDGKKIALNFLIKAGPDDISDIRRLFEGAVSIIEEER